MGLTDYFHNVLGVQSILCPDVKPPQAQPSNQFELWKEEARGAVYGQVLFFHLKKKSEESLFSKAPYSLLKKMIQAMKIPEDQWRVLEITPESLLDKSGMNSCRSYLLTSGFPIIVILGVEGYEALFAEEPSGSQGRGNWFEMEGIKLMPTHSPLFLLENPLNKGDTWTDLKKIMGELKIC